MSLFTDHDLFPIHLILFPMTPPALRLTFHETTFASDERHIWLQLVLGTILTVIGKYRTSFSFSVP